MLLIRRLKIVGFKSQFSSYYFRMLIDDLETLILCFWVVMPPFLWMSQIFSEHLQPLCCPSHPRFLNSLMRLQNPFPLISMCLWSDLSHKSVSWGTPLPWHICWRYYYDPRCLRGSSSGLAMICVPSVMILAFILESIPWCYLVVGILLLGFEPEIHSTYLMLIVFASSFRILVTLR